MTAEGPGRPAPAALTIRPATESDAPAVLRIARELVAEGDTYTFAADTGDRELLAYWLPPAGQSFVAVSDGEVAGVYVLRANQSGRGAHVANASYAVAAAARGRGLGRALGEHSLEQARALGYRAMQFNFVVSTNTAAVELWTALGFRIVGRLPAVFAHPVEGLVDAFVMHRFL